MPTNPSLGTSQRLAAALAAALLIAGAGPAAQAAGEREGGGAAETADMSVQEAWANAREDWRRLQNASDDAWDGARQKFQESWSRLQRLMSERDGTAPPPDDPAGLER